MEALILYFVLFFPNVQFSPVIHDGIPYAQTLPFSTVRELMRLLTYTLPAIALLLYLIAGRNRNAELKAPYSEEAPRFYKTLFPCKQDIIPFAIGLPALVIIGLSVSFLISLSTLNFTPVRIGGPYNFFAWIAMIFACLGTGYLEEIYFRYYLLSKTKNIIPNTAVRVVFSTLLFSISHIHDGPWGVLNAAIAGLILSGIFLRYRSLHGVALAHAGYNMFVYTMGAIQG
ncbi:MAG: CPBP family intramembrane metalloprotease [Treponema sp.]|nr:CPBP family intramembrane metalloprotease [Treponema sp.]